MSTLSNTVSGLIRKRTKALSVPEKHQLKIAKQSMDYHCLGCILSGGPNHYEAASIIHRLTGQIVAIDADCTCKDPNRA